jgi:hypothetical protein
MNKAVKLGLAIFFGIDIFVAGFFLLANLRVTLFGMGSIPGGGSAIDMAFFLLPAFAGWVAGDRLYYFLTYKERKAKKLQELETQKSRSETAQNDKMDGLGEKVAVAPGSIWEERDWDDKLASKTE